MIDRKYGHIMTIASIGSLLTIPADEFIKLTTIYPQLLTQEKKLSDILDKAELKLPRSTPEEVANKAVEGMLMNETKIIVSTTFITQFEIILTLLRRWKWSWSALSMRFAKEGCKIAIADIDYKNAQKTAEEIKEKYKVDCKAFECDITNYSAILN
ncbi:hypothetical protein PVAND_014196 [Polypedilum vanderplanki]|uniref:Uncharacterized protein n=1 Tax=Polypedilum vanderplanki TaxID=319348 RepID=A0A9J6CS07_POLVA|nr:hypothetical protein PVAND_014196 [Polypedilum vanderplanki]